MIAGQGAARFLVRVEGFLACRDRGRVIQRSVVTLDGVGTPDLPCFGQPPQRPVPASRLTKLVTQPLLEVLDLGEHFQFALVRLGGCKQHVRNSDTISH